MFKIYGKNVVIKQVQNLFYSYLYTTIVIQF